MVIDGPGLTDGEDPNESPKHSEQTLPAEKGMDQGKVAGGRACEEHPMHTKRLLEKQRQRLSLIKQNGELQQKPATATVNSETDSGVGSGQKVDNYVNIGDISSAVAERVMEKKVHGTRGVQRKCLQWLNSLDNDDSS